jgi:hypothetical protein
MFAFRTKTTRRYASRAPHRYDSGRPVNKEGIIHGCRRVPTTCVIFREGSWPCVALVADRFGRMNVGTVFGWVFLSHQIEAALASYLGGVARDSFGNYTAAFLGAGILAVMAAMMALLVRRRPASASPAEARS